MAHEPDPLDVNLCDMIEKEVSPEKARWARKLLNIRQTPGLVLTPGLWLRFPKDPPSRIRVEVIAVGKGRCRVFKNGDFETHTIDIPTLLRYRKTLVPPGTAPSWLYPGAHFLDPLAPRLDARWVVRTVQSRRFTARHLGDGTFGAWDVDEDNHIRPVLTSWERLDEEAV